MLHPASNPARIASPSPRRKPCMVGRKLFAAIRSRKLGLEDLAGTDDAHRGARRRTARRASPGMNNVAATVDQHSSRVGKNRYERYHLAGAPGSRKTGGGSPPAPGAVSHFRGVLARIPIGCPRANRGWMLAQKLRGTNRASRDMPSIITPAVTKTAWSGKITSRREKTAGGATCATSL